ncbi:MAG: hypothetical protein IJY47_06890 [Clostridia bacterium]|nr:hypothetical protein [Clostridia bacterium]
MSIALLFFISFAVGVGAKAFSKLCSNMVAQSSAAKYSLILVVNSLVACLFFWISSGFSLSVNTYTLCYSIIYALVVAISILSGVIAYRYASISDVNVISGACGMVCTAVVGWSFFSERVETVELLRLAVMLAATGFVFLDQKRKVSAEHAATAVRKRNLVSLVAVMAVIAACGCANTMVLKCFAMSKSVTDEISFFFFTNVVLCVGAAMVFWGACLRKKRKLRDALLLLYPKRLISIAGNTVCSNISSVVSVLIIAQMDVSIYSPISSAIGIMVGLVGSLIFRERLGVFSYVAAALACAAVII